MPSGGAEGRVYGVYTEVASRAVDPKIEVHGVYTEVASRAVDPKIEVYIVYLEVMTTMAPPEPTGAFVGWGIPI